MRPTGQRARGNRSPGRSGAGAAGRPTLARDAKDRNATAGSRIDRTATDGMRGRERRPSRRSPGRRRGGHRKPSRRNAFCRTSHRPECGFSECDAGESGSSESGLPECEACARAADRKPAVTLDTPTKRTKANEPPERRTVTRTWCDPLHEPARRPSHDAVVLSGRHALMRTPPRECQAPYEIPAVSEPIPRWPLQKEWFFSFTALL